MQLSDFGVIRMDGKAKRPQPGANFNEYQNILASTLAMHNMHQRVTTRRQKIPDVTAPDSPVVEPDHL